MHRLVEQPHMPQIIPLRDILTQFIHSHTNVDIFVSLGIIPVMMDTLRLYLRTVGTPEPPENIEIQIHALMILRYIAQIAPDDTKANMATLGIVPLVHQVANQDPNHYRLQKHCLGLLCCIAHLKPHCKTEVQLLVSREYSGCCIDHILRTMNRFFATPEDDADDYNIDDEKKNILYLDQDGAQEIQMIGCSYLGNLVRLNEEQHIEKMLKFNNAVIEAITQAIMYAPENESLQFKAINALAIFTFANPSLCIQRMLQSNTIVVILRCCLNYIHNTILLHRALVIFMQIASLLDPDYSSYIKSQFAVNGGLNVLKQVLMQYRHEKDHRELVLNALLIMKSILSNHPRNIDLLESMNIIEHVCMTFFAIDDVDLQHACLLIMISFLYSSESRNRIIEFGMLSQVMVLMLKHKTNLNIQTTGVTFLVLVDFHASEESRQDVLHTYSIQAVIDAMQNFPQDEQIHENGCLGLGIILRNADASSINPKTPKFYNAFSTVVLSMRNFCLHPGIQKSGCQFISRCESNCPRSPEAVEIVLQAIERFMHDPDDSIVNYGSSALLALWRSHEENRTKILSCNGLELVDKIIYFYPFLREIACSDFCQDFQQQK